MATTDIDFADRIRQLAARVPDQIQHISTEEATKNALVLPFISALGYDVFDPCEVTPELSADVGVKKGEKVDFAILKDAKPIMLLECKECSANLDEVHASQLYRYFSVTDTRLAALTNGIIYRFYSDLDAPNKMDARPFLEVNLLALDDSVLGELKKFTKSAFRLESVLANAGELKHTREIKRLMAQEIQEPSEEFVRFFAKQVHHGFLTQSVREHFREITRRAIQELISERVSDRLKSALDSVRPTVPEPPPAGTGHDAVATTQEELHAFYIVVAILTAVVEPRRVTDRDQKSYFAVNLDDNKLKPICRLWFNSAQKYIGLFDEAKTETRHRIHELADIYGFAEELRAAATRYMK